MLDDTLVLFTTEFGRTPFTQSAADVVGKGRDHNQYGFTVWMAGAGLKHGTTMVPRTTSAIAPSISAVHWHDFHATVLHLLGIDHERLTYLSQRHPPPLDQCPRPGDRPVLVGIVAKVARSEGDARHNRLS